MILKKIDKEKDYEEICNLWKLQEVPVIPKDILPFNGMKVLENGKIIAAAWVYLTDSSLAWLEWYVGDPMIDKAKRAKALELVSDGLIEFCSKMGKTLIYTCISMPSMKGLAEKKGFKETNNNCSVLMKRI